MDGPRSHPGKIDIFSFEFAHEARNPLAFVHGGLNLIAAQMMGKPRGFIFPESSPESFRGLNPRMTPTALAILLVGMAVLIFAPVSFPD